MNRFFDNACDINLKVDFMRVCCLVFLLFSLLFSYYYSALACSCVCVLFNQFAY